MSSVENIINTNTSKTVCAQQHNGSGDMGTDIVKQAQNVSSENDKDSTENTEQKETPSKTCNENGLEPKAEAASDANVCGDHKVEGVDSSQTLQKETLKSNLQIDKLISETQVDTTPDLNDESNETDANNTGKVESDQAAGSEAEVQNGAKETEGSCVHNPLESLQASIVSEPVTVASHEDLPSVEGALKETNSSSLSDSKNTSEEDQSENMDTTTEKSVNEIVSLELDGDKVNANSLPETETDPEESVSPKDRESSSSDKESSIVDKKSSSLDNGSDAKMENAHETVASGAGESGMEICDVSESVSIADEVSTSNATTEEQVNAEAYEYLEKSEVGNCTGSDSAMETSTADESTVPVCSQSNQSADLKHATDSESQEKQPVHDLEERATDESAMEISNTSADVTCDVLVDEKSSSEVMDTEEATSSNAPEASADLQLGTEVQSAEVPASEEDTSQKEKVSEGTIISGGEGVSNASTDTCEPEDVQQTVSCSEKVFSQSLSIGAQSKSCLKGLFEAAISRISSAESDNENNFNILHEQEMGELPQGNPEGNGEVVAPVTIEESPLKADSKSEQEGNNECTEDNENKVLENKDEPSMSDSLTEEKSEEISARRDSETCDLTKDETDLNNSSEHFGLKILNISTQQASITIESDDSSSQLDDCTCVIQDCSSTLQVKEVVGAQVVHIPDDAEGDEQNKTHEGTLQVTSIVGSSEVLTIDEDEPSEGKNEAIEGASEAKEDDKMDIRDDATSSDKADTLEGTLQLTSVVGSKVLTIDDEHSEDKSEAIEGTSQAEEDDKMDIPDDATSSEQADTLEGTLQVTGVVGAEVLTVDENADTNKAVEDTSQVKEDEVEKKDSASEEKAETAEGQVKEAGTEAEASKAKTDALEDELLGGPDDEQMPMDTNEAALLDDEATETEVKDAPDTADTEAKSLEASEAIPATDGNESDDEEEDDDDDEDEDDDDDQGDTHDMGSDSIETEMVEVHNPHEDIDESLIESVDIEMIEDPDMIQPAGNKILKAVISSSTEECMVDCLPPSKSASWKKAICNLPVGKMKESSFHESLSDSQSSFDSTNNQPVPEISEKESNEDDEKISSELPSVDSSADLPSVDSSADLPSVDSSAELATPAAIVENILHRLIEDVCRESEGEESKPEEQAEATVESPVTMDTSANETAMSTASIDLKENSADVIASDTSPETKRGVTLDLSETKEEDEEMKSPKCKVAKLSDSLEAEPAVPHLKSEADVKPAINDTKVQLSSSGKVQSPTTAGVKRSLESSPENDEPRKKSRLDSLVNALHQRVEKKDEDSSETDTEEQPALYITEKELDEMVEKRVNHVLEELKRKVTEAQRQVVIWRALAKDLQEQSKLQSLRPKLPRQRHVSIQVDIPGASRVPPSPRVPTKRQNTGSAKTVMSNSAAVVPARAGQGVALVVTSATPANISKAINSLASNSQMPVGSAVFPPPAPQPTARVVPSCLPAPALPPMTASPVRPAAKPPAAAANTGRTAQQKDDVVDLTCDDDVAVISSTPAPRKKTLPTQLSPLAAPNGGVLVVRQEGQNLVPVVPKPQLPKDLAPGTYLLSQTPQGAVLQPIVNATAIGQQAAGGESPASTPSTFQQPAFNAAAPTNPIRPPRGRRPNVQPVSLPLQHQPPLPQQTVYPVQVPPPRNQAPPRMQAPHRTTQTSRKSTALPARNRNQGKNNQNKRDGSTSPDVVITTISKQTHPAPPPTLPANAKRPELKDPPPRPVLKISNGAQGIVLSWTHPFDKKIHAEVVKYQIYAYQEMPGPVTSSLWKKVGDVSALPLPMACTLTQFQQGNKYYFIICAVDTHGRYSQFSETGMIKPTGK